MSSSGVKFFTGFSYEPFISKKNMRATFAATVYDFGPLSVQANNLLAFSVANMHCLLTLKSEWGGN